MSTPMAAAVIVLGVGAFAIAFLLVIDALMSPLRCRCGCGELVGWKS